MIDINFLKRPNPPLLNMRGTEFMDWQNNSTFYSDVVDALTAIYDPEKKEFDLIKSARDEIVGIIKKHTNMSINLVVGEGMDFFIDAGYISTGNLLNIQGIEQWYDKKYTKISEAFKDLKKDVIKGWADPRTGKVEGDFKNINFNLTMSFDIGKYLDGNILLKYRVTVPQAVAAFILHECGHSWGGMLFISSKIIDNALLTQAIKTYNNESDTARKTTIIKETLKELECISDVPGRDLAPDEIVVYFNKCVVTRDARRSLSLGVAEMTSEVLADAYAVRFGASLGLVSGLASFGIPTIFGAARSTLVASAILSIVFNFTFAGTWFTLFAITVLATQYSILTPGTYDTPYRRIKTVLRENITALNDKTMPKSQKVEAIKSLRKMEELIEENKPFFESTAFQRTLGWIGSGSDFRKQDIENYTADLVGNKLALYSSDLFA